MCVTEIDIVLTTNARGPDDISDEEVMAAFAVAVKPSLADVDAAMGQLNLGLLDNKQLRTNGVLIINYSFSSLLRSIIII